MPQETVWSSTRDATGQRFELEPPGFVAFYRVALATLIFGGAVVLPLGLLGVFGALVFDDFELALRGLMGLAGAATCAAVAWLTLRVLLAAKATRARITVTGAGVLVEVGMTSVRRHAWLTPLGEVSAGTPDTDDLGRGGIILSAGDETMWVATGYAQRDRDRLLTAIRSAVKDTPPSDGVTPALEALGPPWSERVRDLVRDVVAPLRRPTPYLLVDIGALVGTVVLTWFLDEVVDWRDAYPVAFAIFILGLAGRWFDGSYIAGLRAHLSKDRGWGLRYVGAALCIGLAGAVAMTPRLTFLPAAAIAMVSSLGLHAAMLRRAKGEATPSTHRALDLSLAASLVPLSILHEAAMFEFVVGSSEDLAVLSLAFVPVTVLVAYAPVRLHAFVDDSGGRANVAWFWLTAVWLGLGPIVAIVAALVREF